VLLRLITAEELDIYAVKISKIVEDYLEEIRSMEFLDMETATEFLVIAATLLELKSRSLLPEDDYDDEEDIEFYETRDLLLSRLVEAKTFQSAGAQILQMMERARLSKPRSLFSDDRFKCIYPDLLKNKKPSDFAKALVKMVLLKDVPQSVSVSHISLAPMISVEEACQDIVNQLLLKDKGTVSFWELTADYKSAGDILIYFLASLELYRNGVVELFQLITFGDFQIELEDTSTPVLELLSNLTVS
jgi:segregation and condensation protein A